jgi:putative membrane protein
MKGVLWGCGLYYGVLAFNLLVTFWIGEFLLGTIGVLIYLPILILFSLRHRNASPNH